MSVLQQINTVSLINKNLMKPEDLTPDVITIANKWITDSARNQLMENEYNNFWVIEKNMESGTQYKVYCGKNKQIAGDHLNIPDIIFVFEKTSSYKFIGIIVGDAITELITNGSACIIAWISEPPTMMSSIGHLLSGMGGSSPITGINSDGTRITIGQVHPKPITAVTGSTGTAAYIQAGGVMIPVESGSNIQVVNGGVTVGLRNISDYKYIGSNQALREKILNQERDRYHGIMNHPGVTLGEFARILHRL